MAFWKAYYRIGGETMKAVEAVAIADKKSRIEQSIVAKSLGADGFYPKSSDGGIAALAFKGEVPKGFKQLKGRWHVDGINTPALPNLATKLGKEAQRVLDEAPVSVGKNAFQKAAGIDGIHQINGGAIHFPTTTYVELPAPTVVASVPRRDGDDWAVPADFTEITASEYHSVFDDHNAALKSRKESVNA